VNEATNIWRDYPGQTQVRQRLKKVRADRQLTTNEVAAIIEEETGFRISGAQWAACESGVTKNVPLWAVIAFMNRLGVHPTEIFDEGY
jgi:hypothetical protein